MNIHKAGNCVSEYVSAYAARNSNAIKKALGKQLIHHGLHVVMT